MSSLRIILPNAESTMWLGEQIASRVENNLLIAISGQLGAGKTTLAQGIGEGLGLEEDVNSPTFTMLNEYQTGRIPFYHFDLYRMQEDFQGKDISTDPSFSMLRGELEEFLSCPGIILVEWAELGKPLLFDLEHLRLDLRYLENTSEASPDLDCGREVFIEAQGKSASHQLDLLCQDLETAKLEKKGPNVFVKF